MNQLARGKNCSLEYLNREMLEIFNNTEGLRVEKVEDMLNPFGNEENENGRDPFMDDFISEGNDNTLARGMN